MHVPSFFVGSLVSGSAFLLVHQQLSHRERLSRKWLLAERAENEIRAQIKNLKSQIQSQKTFAEVNNSSFGKETVMKYYKETLDYAHNFFGGKD
mmetsp:Transcript_6329/g.15690  ORF Transcript_6329/g.15690 Transcript_6329/m.15690 type:complete len:94 (+) Transcript_6329:111-392(+)